MVDRTGMQIECGSGMRRSFAGTMFVPIRRQRARQNQLPVSGRFRSLRASYILCKSLNSYDIILMSAYRTRIIHVVVSLKIIRVTVYYDIAEVGLPAASSESQLHQKKAQ